ncbi:lipase family protein [Crocinitomix catalasitica]|uniref:lipase family protein n=1 Tax=Crocinitomix catalasitica TaxID=184607 RepID=UPI000488D4F2|nr:lipase family protein [Crocinitomix catalasitica]
MRILFIILFLFTSFISTAQLRSGFDKNEARDMIAFCNSYTFLDLYQNDEEIIPAGFKKVYSSQEYSLDNMFQVYTKGNIGVINLRGSTDEKSSWLQNFYSSLIPAAGEIGLKGKTIQYTFATDTGATVHSGYALAIAYIIEDVVEQINLLNEQKIFDIYITGHSQGGAVAQLLMAQLHHLPGRTISFKNTFKTYAFASPMCGNRRFVQYYHNVINNGYSFNIINPADLVPTFPLTYNDSTFFSMDEVINILKDPGSFSIKRKIKDGAFRILQNPLKFTMEKLGGSVEKQIDKYGDDVVMPAPVREINYARMYETIEIMPAEYPKRLIDSTILTNDSLMAVYERDSNGDFTNAELYEKAPMFYQHKPYNYYVTIIKLYFPDNYVGLKQKYLQENL